MTLIVDSVPAIQFNREGGIMLRLSKIHLSALLISTLVFTGCVNAQKKASAKPAQSKLAQSKSGAGFQSKDLSSPTSDQNIMNELTGKNISTGLTKAQLKKMPLAAQHLAAGQKAAVQKNYIMAIKHYNTVIKKYPRSAQVKPALVAKSKVYKEMGLTEPAQLNMKLAQRKPTFSSKKQVVKNQSSQKTIK